MLVYIFIKKQKKSMLQHNFVDEEYLAEKGQKSRIEKHPLCTAISREISTK